MNGFGREEGTHCHSGSKFVFKLDDTQEGKQEGSDCNASEAVNLKET